MKRILVEVHIWKDPDGTLIDCVKFWSVHPTEPYTVIEHASQQKMLMGMRGAKNILQSLKQHLYRQPLGKESKRLLFFM